MKKNILKKLFSFVLAFAMALTSLHPITKAAETNILTGKAYTNSTLNGHNPATAVDGSVDSYWDTGYYYDSPWIDFELGELYLLDSVNVVNYWATNDRYYHYDVYTSIDGINYDLVWEKRGTDKASKAGDTFVFEEPVYATHIKFVGVYNSANAGFHFNELSAYGTIAEDVDDVLLVRQKLNAMLTAKYYESDYTAGSWNAYLSQKEAAKVVLDKEDATSEELKQAMNNLQGAIDGLTAGNPDEKVEGTFRVGTFNIWAPNPNHPDTQAIATMFDRVELDYIGVQEVDKENGRDERDVLAVLESDLEALSDIDYESNYQQAIEYLEGAYGIGQISSTQIKDYTSGLFTQVSNEEGRGWQRMLVEIDGKEVAIYNAHLSYVGSSSLKALQSNVNELKALLDADTCPYIVVTGDFNASEELAPIAKDYDLVNGKDGQWYVSCDSYGENGDGKAGENSENAIDNIIVSRNIHIANSRLVHHDGLSDHYMLYADLELEAPEADLADLVATCSFEEEPYTSDSWAAYVAALENANALLASDDLASKTAELHAAAKQLRIAISQLNSEKRDNLALNKEVYVKDMEGGWNADGSPVYDFFQPSNVTDGVVDTAAMNGNRISLASTEGNYMTIDLGKVYDFNGIVVEYFPIGKELNISVSKDGSEWTPIHEIAIENPVTGKYGKLNIELDTMATGRYVKFEQPVIPMPDSIYAYKWGIAEIRVLGNAADTSEVDGLLYMISKMDRTFYTDASLNALDATVTKVKADLASDATQVAADAAFDELNASFKALKIKREEDTTPSINVALQANGGLADADNVTVVGGDKAFLNNNVLKDSWTAASAATPVSAKVDFDKKYAVDSVRVIFKEQDSADKQLGFTVYYFDANGSQVELYKGTSYNEANDATTLDLGHKFFSEYTLDDPIVMKGLKVTVTSNTTGSEVAIAEVQAFGKEVSGLSGEKNLALGAKTEASQQYSAGYGAQIATDGVTNVSNAYWHSGKGLPQTLTVDFGESCTLTKMVVYPYTDNKRYYTYDLEVSNDGTTWYPVASREETYGDTPSFVGETYEFEPYMTARYARLVALNNSNESEEFHIREFEVYGISNAVNIALGKNVSSTNAENGTSPDCITDGDLSAHWDGGEASEESPQSFTVDLGVAAYMSAMKAYPYTGGRWYDYNIEVSADGLTWTPVANRKDTHGTVTAFAGETYRFETPVYGRFVRVNMTYNSANPSVHMREFEVFGEFDPEYIAPTTDLLDPNNVAFNKPVHSHLDSSSLSTVVDGFDETACSGAFAPAYFDIDLEENYDISDIELKFPEKKGRYYYFTVYGSTDATNYDRLYQERSQELPEKGKYIIDLSELENSTYRIVRVFVELVSDAKNAVLSEVRVHGQATGENTDKLIHDYTKADADAASINAVETILDMEAFDDTEYAAPITTEETIENVYGIIDRIIGAKYRDWFTFEIVNDPTRTKDWYSVEFDTTTNKVIIKGNEGLSLSSGLNYYLKNFCHVAVSEQTVNGRMPAQIVPVLEKVTKENQVEVRYAFNYCTLNYTFSYADAAEFQREYDWMALNGVNCVLDLAGQEAVWIMFLMNFGYTYDEAKDWIAGGSYYAWQFMDNMEVCGGPVADEWVKGRLEMARENQRWKVSLGMQTVLQGYAGMIPNNFGDYQPDVEILQQGTWCNLPRPDMIRTDGELYDQYAELFYQAQHWAFGATSNYYAVDPFHEGGIRPDDLSDELIAANVLESLMKYDEDAVWMVQAWWANPTNGLLNGMGEYREDHVLILDLMGLNSVYNTPYWQQTSYYNGATVLEEDEFNSTSWVWCLLENYGGNPGMDGRAEEAVKRIQYAYENAEHMKGLGFISEATYDNPFIYDLVFDMAWVSLEELQATTPEQFLRDWKDLWVTSRYGVDSENAKEAWDILIDTLYSGSSSPSQVILSTNPSLDTAGSRYSFSKVEKALQLLYEDFDELSHSECYRYDLTELMRQIVSNYATELRGDLSKAHTAGDLAAFQAKKAEFLAAFDLLDEVTATQQDLMIGEWVGSAANWATDTGADDFAYDAMTINAKTIITVWAPTTYLGTYAFRHYNGVIRDVYKPIWESYLDGLEEVMVDGVKTTQTINYTQHCMEWIYTPWQDQIQSETNPNGYILKADNSIENMDRVTAKVLDAVIYIDPVNKGNVAYEKSVVTNAERPDSPGAPGGGYAYNVTDGLNETYWDGITWEVEAGNEPYVIVDLEKVYDIDRLNVVNYAAGTRYYYYDVYASVDGKEWTQIADREEAYGTIPSPDAGDDYIYETDKPQARYVKLVGLYNSSNEGYHVKEIRVYGTEAVVEDVFGPVENVVATAVDYKTITLTWDAVEDAQSYVVERFTAEGEWIELANVAETTYTHAGVKTGKEYTYRVTAVNGEEVSEPSEEAKATPVLSGEVELSIAMNGRTKFDLTWTAVDGATRYIVYRKSSDSEWKKILTLGKDARSYTSKDMKPNTYQYMVKAARYDSVDRVQTNGSNVVEGIVGATEMRPTNAKVEVVDGSVVLTWDKVAGMTNYEIYRSKDGGAYRHVKTTNATTLTNTTLKAGSTYSYKIRAYAVVNGEKVYGPEVETTPITME